MISKLTFSRTQIKPKAELKDKISFLRKNLEEKRTQEVKENILKATVIARADISFVQNTLHELDTFHKELFERMKKNVVMKSNETEIQVSSSVSEENVFRD